MVFSGKLTTHKKTSSEPSPSEINMLVAMFNHGRFAEMEALGRGMTARFPKHSLGWKAVGTALLQQGRHAEALGFLQKTAELSHGDAETHNNLGNTFLKLGRLPEAEASYRRVLDIKPDFAEAHYTLGNVLYEQNRLPEAEASYRRALYVRPDFAEAYYNLGSTLHDLGRLPEAEASYRHALDIKPDFVEALYNLGNTLNDLGRLAEAEISCRQALDIRPDFVEAHFNLSNTLFKLGRLAEADISYERVLRLKPDYPFAFGMYLHNKMHCCNWKEIDKNFQELLCGIDAGKPVSNPLAVVAIPSSLAQQKRCAEIYVHEKYPEVPCPQGIKGRYSHDKIRLGYFSSDFYNHATAYLAAELFEQHDRTRFEVIGFTYGVAPNDGMRQRLSTAFDRFLDVRNQSDLEICNLARSLEIDIAVDLKGHTGGARTGIFALHSAPIQVSYLGYPGTMGATYIDYLIADPTLIPVEHQQYYSEKIAYLPNSYQVNDSHRHISDRQFTRSEAGLPDNGFVFCCFNNNFKITPTVFGIWMQFLHQVEGSVLWLLGGNTQVMQNLHNEAKKQGIAPERLVFAQHMDLPDHLARHRLADLFLDTFFCNAHTTASDALWAGLPVLTCLGETFASRVAASLLNAIGLPELIAHSHEEYKTLALDLAQHPEKLALIKQQLARNRITHPLFNTALFTRYIEDAYIQMWQRHQEALLPDHIYVRTTV